MPGTSTEKQRSTPRGCKACVGLAGGAHAKMAHCRSAEEQEARSLIKQPTAAVFLSLASSASLA
eukprot:6036309-Lingulodinium_polyedra.AAC.1